MGLFTNIPWADVTSFLTALTLVVAILGPKLKFVRHFMGENLQEMLGVTALKELMTTEIEDRVQMHAQNQREFRVVKAQIVEVSALAAEVAEKADSHYRDLMMHHHEG